MNYIEDLNNFYVFVVDLLALENVPTLEVNNDMEYISGLEVVNSKATKIMLNLEKMPSDIETLYWSIAHELRHAIQLESLVSDSPDFTDLEKQAIERELNNYKPHGDEYKNQFIEIDAFAFADFIIYLAFSIRRDYGDNLTQSQLMDIQDRSSIIANMYQKDEILESLRYSGFQPKKPKNYS